SITDPSRSAGCLVDDIDSILEGMSMRTVVLLALVTAITGCQPDYPQPQYPQYAYAPPPQYAPPPYQPAPQPYQAQPPATPTATPAAMPAMPAPYGYQPSAPPPRDNLQLSSQPLVTPRSHLHDAEVIGDLAAVGALASIDLCVRQNITDGNAVTFILLAGL